MVGNYTLLITYALPLNIMNRFQLTLIHCVHTQVTIFPKKVFMSFLPKLLAQSIIQQIWIHISPYELIVFRSRSISYNQITKIAFKRIDLPFVSVIL